MGGFLGPQWHQEALAKVDLQSQVALAKVEIPAYLNQKVLDVLPNVASLIQPPAVERVIREWKNSIAFANTQARLQRIASDLVKSSSFDASHLSGLAAWRDFTAVDPGLVKDIAEKAVLAAGIGRPGGLTAILGAKASVAAGLYGYTWADEQGVRIREDQALGVVLEAKELLRDPDRAEAVADVDVDEALVEDFETFFLTSPDARDLYQEFVGEIAIKSPGPKERLKARGAVILSIFLIFYAALIGAKEASDPNKDVTAADHGTAIAESIGITGGAVIVWNYMEKVRRMPEDEEEAESEDPDSHGDD